MSEKNKTRKRLADIIRSRLLRKYGGLKVAVRNIGLFSYDALRQDLSKNRFFESDLLKLCPETDLPSVLALLRKEYDFTLKKSERGMRRLAQAPLNTPSSLNDAFNIIDAKMERLENMATAPREIVPSFFKTMTGTDLLAVFMPDEFPSHWVGPEAASWAPVIYKALADGAAVVYFHPSDEIAKQVRDNGCTAKMLTGNDVKPAFDAFCARLLGIGASEKGPDNVAVLNNLAVVSCSNPAAFTPQHRYGLYFHRGENLLLVRATEAIPVKHNTETNMANSRYWLLTLSYQFTSLLQQICEWTLNDEIKKLREDNDSTGRVRILQKILERCYFVNATQQKSK